MHALLWGGEGREDKGQNKEQGTRETVNESALFNTIGWYWGLTQSTGCLFGYVGWGECDSFVFLPAQPHSFFDRKNPGPIISLATMVLLLMKCSNTSHPGYAQHSKNNTAFLAHHLYRLSRRERRKICALLMSPSQGR